MAKKIKLSRKQMKQPDEFLSWTEQAWDWVAENIVYAAGILVGAVVVVLLVQWGVKSVMSAPDPVEADLTKAMSALKKPIKTENDLLSDGYFSEDERNLAASESLAAFLKQYEGKPGADVAILYLARTQERMKNFSDAISSYNRLAASELAQKDDYYLNSASMGLARSYFGDKKYADALENFKKVAAQDSEFKSDALIGMARCQFELGDIEASNQTLKTARDEHHDSWNVQPAGFLAGYWSNKKEEDQKVKDNPPETPSPADGSTAEKGPDPLPSSTAEGDTTAKPDGTAPPVPETPPAAGGTTP